MRQTRYQSHRSECDNTFNLNRINDKIQSSFHTCNIYMLTYDYVPMGGRKILA